MYVNSTLESKTYMVSIGFSFSGKSESDVEMRYKCRILHHESHCSVFLFCHTIDFQVGKRF